MLTIAVSTKGLVIRLITPDEVVIREDPMNARSIQEAQSSGLYDLFHEHVQEALREGWEPLSTDTSSVSLRHRYIPGMVIPFERNKA